MQQGQLALSLKLHFWWITGLVFDALLLLYCTIFNVVVGPVSHIWLEPDSGFRPGKPVTCKANGYPRPTFHWIRASDNATVSEVAKLVVKSANHSYLCIATNEVRGQTHTVMSAEVNYDTSSGYFIGYFYTIYM